MLVGSGLRAFDGLRAEKLNGKTYKSQVDRSWPFVRHVAAVPTATHLSPLRTGGWYTTVTVVRSFSAWVKAEPLTPL